MRFFETRSFIRGACLDYDYIIYYVGQGPAQRVGYALIRQTGIVYSSGLNCKTNEISNLFEHYLTIFIKCINVSKNEKNRTNSA